MKLQLSQVITAGTLVLVGTMAQAQTAPDVPRLNLKSAGLLVSGDDAYAWKVKKASWSAQVEAGKCNKVSNCMSNPAINPFAPTDPKGIVYYSDCADWPYYSRAYFAWKRNLPFSFISGVTVRNPNEPVEPGKKLDIRYTRDGSRATRRTDTIATGGYFPNAKQLLGSSLSDQVSTATLRMPVIPPAGEPVSDFYPVALDRDGVRPGTAVYSADGHAAIVYKVEADGVVKVIDAHPDNSLTKNVYTERFQRSRQEQGAIFKRFRPIELVNYSTDGEGNLIGGQIVVKTDDQIPGVNYEQVKTKFGTDAQFVFALRRKLAQGVLKLNVVTEFKNSIDNLCNVLRQREESVEIALKAGMDEREHQEVLPQNIFGAEGDWETYSSPGRDISLRKYYKAALDSLKTNVAGLKSGDAGFTYTGSNLAQDLYNTYRSVASSCTVGYMSRAGGPRKLDMEQVNNLLFDISFDPYHCADLRWGDKKTGAQVCGEDMRWYNAEQYLRSMTERNTAAFHGFNLDQLEAENAKNMAPVLWDTNFIRFINSLAAPGVTLR
jgi:hypothetical protein